MKVLQKNLLAGTLLGIMKVGWNTHTKWVLFLLSKAQSGFASSFLYGPCQNNKDLHCPLKENHFAMHFYLDMHEKSIALGLPWWRSG